MGVMDTLRRWVEPPAVEITVYQCLDCGSTFQAQGSSCPECGGRLKETEDTSETLEYQYLGPFQ